MASNEKSAVIQPFVVLQIFFLTTFKIFLSLIFSSF